MQLPACSFWFKMLEIIVLLYQLCFLESKSIANAAHAVWLATTRYRKVPWFDSLYRCSQADMKAIRKYSAIGTLCFFQCFYHILVRIHDKWPPQTDHQLIDCEPTEPPRRQLALLLAVSWFLVSLLAVSLQWPVELIRTGSTHLLVQTCCMISWINYRLCRQVCKSLISK